VRSDYKKDPEAVKSSIEQQSSRVESRVEFRDASLPGYELGSRGIELVVAE
jgi:hypothetical protein